MKPVLTTFLLLLSISGFSQEGIQIPHEFMTGERMKVFIDSLRQKTLYDSLRFDRKDLSHKNGHTYNNKAYGILISFELRYMYRTDIVEPWQVKEFAMELLRPEIIESIIYVKGEDAPIFSGYMSKDGWIDIVLKPNAKVDFEVGGLKYRRGTRKRAGDNFLQQRSGEVMIRH